MRKYNIATDSGISQVFGLPLVINGLNCFIHCTDAFSEGPVLYEISEVETGMKASESNDIVTAIKIATSNFSQNPDAIEKGKKILQGNGFSFPLNKI